MQFQLVVDWLEEDFLENFDYYLLAFTFLSVPYLLYFPNSPSLSSLDWGFCNEASSFRMESGRRGSRSKKWKSDRDFLFRRRIQTRQVDSNER